MKSLLAKEKVIMTVIESLRVGKRNTWTLLEVKIMNGRNGGDSKVTNGAQDWMRCQ